MCHGGVTDATEGEVDLGNVDEGLASVGCSDNRCMTLVEVLCIRMIAHYTAE